MKLEKIGFDNILNATIWEVTAYCTNCCKRLVIHYSSCESYTTELKRVNAMFGWLSGYLCNQCMKSQPFKGKGLSQQLTLFPI